MDSTGAPTKTWLAYRNKATAGAVLAAAMRGAYGDLFRTYPEANRKDSEALRNYFSAHTNVAESTLGLIVNTFKTLAAAADFESATPGTTDGDVGGETPPRDKKEPQRREQATDDQGAGRPAININIQLQLPATDGAPCRRLC